MAVLLDLVRVTNECRHVSHMAISKQFYTRIGVSSSLVPMSECRQR